jgi:hypothetical protein
MSLVRVEVMGRPLALHGPVLKVGDTLFIDDAVAEQVDLIRCGRVRVLSPTPVEFPIASSFDQPPFHKMVCRETARRKRSA